MFALPQSPYDFLEDGCVVKQVGLGMEEDVLRGVVAYVPRRVDGDLSVHNAVTSKLSSLGAKLAGRFGKEVTHIVFLKKLLPSPKEQAQQEAALRDLYEKAEKVGLSGSIVCCSSKPRQRSNPCRAQVSCPPCRLNTMSASCQTSGFTPARSWASRPWWVQEQHGPRDGPAGMMDHHQHALDIPMLCHAGRRVHRAKATG